MFKIDLHSHSIGSPDGGIQPDQYAQIFEDNLLDYIAITDHDSIVFAQRIKESLGNRIIIGEEITTHQGEIIGLFLTDLVRPNQSALKTAQAIKDQGGLVYIPHPFETIRKGITKLDLERIANLVDIVEVYNGRAFVQNRGPEAATWARLNDKATAASSDAHGQKGVGSAYSTIKEEPSADNLAKQLKLAHHSMQRPPIKTLLYPKANRVLKKLGRK
jgi:predicted metal-dependent phosphoesterase TrpH